MPLYFYPGLFMIAFFLMLLFRTAIAARSDNSEQLYTEALKNENSGKLEDALVIYENAFAAAKKIRRNPSFKDKIAAKLQLLHTVIEYNRNFVTKK